MEARGSEEMGPYWQVPAEREGVQRPQAPHGPERQVEGRRKPHCEPTQLTDCWETLLQEAAEAGLGQPLKSRAFRTGAALRMP